MGAPHAALPRDLGAQLLRARRPVRRRGDAWDGHRLGRSVGEWPAFPDSAEALRGWRLATNSSSCPTSTGHSFEASNEKLGVTFNRVLTAQDVGSYKPSGRNFKALLSEAERMGIGDGKLLHVAQSLFHDHVPANAIGLPSAWINRRSGRDGWGATPAPDESTSPDFEFDSMASFVKAVDVAVRLKYRDVRHSSRPARNPGRVGIVGCDSTDPPKQSITHDPSQALEPRRLLPHPRSVTRRCPPSNQAVGRVYPAEVTPAAKLRATRLVEIACAWGPGESGTMARRDVDRRAGLRSSAGRGTWHPCSRTG